MHIKIQGAPLVKCSSIVHKSARTVLCNRELDNWFPTYTWCDLYGFPRLNTVSQRGFDYVIPPSVNTAAPLSGFLFGCKNRAEIKVTSSDCGGERQLSVVGMVKVVQPDGLV